MKPNSKEVGQVLQTKDYHVFSILEANRETSPIHEKRIAESIAGRYLMNPIIVNEKYQIIDGQHRFHAAVSCGLPINYIVVKGYGLKEVQILNTNMKNWQKKDHLRSYCYTEEPEYVRLKEFMNMFPDLGLTASLALLSKRKDVYHPNLKSETNKSGKYAARLFQDGEFEIDNYTAAVANAKKIMKIKPYYKGFARENFVKTCISLFNHPNYQHDRMVDKLKKHPTKMKHCANVGEYKLLLEDIYNYRVPAHEKVNLRYL